MAGPPALLLRDAGVAQETDPPRPGEETAEEAEMASQPPPALLQSGAGVARETVPPPPGE